MDAPQSPAASHEEPWLEIVGSRDFPAWLRTSNVSLAFTTYQTGKLFFVGHRADDRLAIFERNFQRCLGLSAQGNALWMSSLYQLWRFENVLAAGQEYEGYDRLYVPRVGYTTGDLDIHDLTVDAAGRTVFVNTKFSCLATLDECQSFAPLWRPPFISRLAPEDRCHLNGLALVDGRAKYVTFVSASDVADAWRDRRRDGGCVIDVTNNEIVCRNLSMPHSPRWYRDRLWVHNSGAGEFGWVDRSTGRFEPICFCPGYLRGLSFVGDYAIVGLSKARHEQTFTGLPLDDRLKEKGAEVRCGLLVIDLRTGDTVHWLRIDGVVTELYDVAVIPGAKRPMAFGFKTDEIQRTITAGEEQPL